MPIHGTKHLVSRNEQALYREYSFAGNCYCRAKRRPSLGGRLRNRGERLEESVHVGARSVVHSTMKGISTEIVEFVSIDSTVQYRVEHLNSNLPRLLAI